jgi:formate/nitrite transporter FocA (FNT family)
MQYKLYINDVSKTSPESIHSFLAYVILINLIGTLVVLWAGYKFCGCCSVLTRSLQEGKRRMTVKRSSPGHCIYMHMDSADEGSL